MHFAYIAFSAYVCNGKDAVFVEGFLTDSVISNVVNKNPNCPALRVARETGMNNVSTFNLISATPKE